MAESRRGLGRGLSALLDEVETAAPEGARPAAAAGAQEVPIELIQRNPDQPRRLFDEGELAELTDSVREKGVLQPILLRPHPETAGEYQIVAGERRWRAAQRAGLRTAPALVRELTDAQVMEIALIENIQRADLNPLEEARGYQAMAAKFHRTQDVIARMVGKSRSHVANTLRLLRLPPRALAHLEAGRLTAGHARALLEADNADDLADRAVEKGLNVRQVETLARKSGSTATAKSSSGRRRPTKDADTRALESDLAEVLGLAVEIKDAGGQGELRIRYTTLEQLDDICRRLLRNGG